MKKLAGSVATIVVLIATAVAVSPVSAAQTVHYTEQDLKMDTAIAIQFAEGDGVSQPYLFSLNGELTQMVLCKVSFDIHKSQILTALRRHPDFRQRTPVSAACVRTNEKPLSPFQN